MTAIKIATLIMAFASIIGSLLAIYYARKATLAYREYERLREERYGRP